MKKTIIAASLLSAIVGVASPASAGVYIIDGTDADDHGFATTTTNEEGWFYIQRGLENIASSSGLTRTQKKIAVLGADDSTSAAFAVQSALSKSSLLTAAGWTLDLLNDSQISDFFGNTGPGLKSTDASLIYMSSWDQEVGGGISGSEQAILDANGAAINSFLGSGGGLFSHVQGYGWLSTLVPGLTVLYGGDVGISLTADGMANFPGLSDADLSSGPYHANFQNVGSVPVLGVDDGGFLDGLPVILGGAGGTITNPEPPSGVPEPSTWALMLLGFGVTGYAMRRGKQPKVRFAF